MLPSRYNQMDNSRIYFSQHKVLAAFPGDKNAREKELHSGCLLLKIEKFPTFQPPQSYTGPRRPWSYLAATKTPPTCEDVVLEWKPTVEDNIPTSPTCPPEDLSMEELQSVGYNPRKGSDAVEMKPFLHVRTEMAEVRSYRLEEKETAKLTFYLNDGSSLPTLHFPDRDHRPFLQALAKFYHFKKSPTEKDLYLIQYSRHKILEKSFTELNLFENTPLQNFMMDPIASTWSGLSKVSNYFFDNKYNEMLSPSDRDDVASSTKVHMRSLLPLSLDGEQDENSFEVITCMEIPPRSPVKRDLPLTESTWQSHKLPDGQIQDFDVLKVIIFKGGMEHGIRKEVWKYLLGFYSPESTTKEREELRKEKEDYYYAMKLQWKTITEDQQLRFTEYRDRKSMVEKDVSRTDRTHAYYAGENNPNIETLREILMTYCMYNFNLGYVQGMSDMLSPLLLVMNDEVEAFWCFVKVMDRLGQNFEISQRTIMLQLENLRMLLGAVENELADYLDSHESTNLFFCFRWVLIWFKREFPISDILLLWEVLWTNLPCRNFHLLVCLAVLSLHKNYIMENQFGFTEILKYINELSMNLNVDQVLGEAESIFNQLCGVSDLPDPVRDILGLPHCANNHSPQRDEELDLERVTPTNQNGTANDDT